MKNRRPIHGVGINDANYVTQKVIDGKMVACSFYRVWRHMLERCYDPKYQLNKPTYVGCSVVKEWLSFMSFREWMMGQEWEGKHLDKDALKVGNKVYGPDTCVFIDRETNSLLSEKIKPGKELPFGVSMRGKKYHAQCTVKGRTQNLGFYDDPIDAHRKWRRTKAKSFARAAIRQTDGRVIIALLVRAAELLYGEQL